MDYPIPMLITGMLVLIVGSLEKPFQLPDPLPLILRATGVFLASAAALKLILE